MGLPVESITPEQAPGYYGWLASLAMLDLPTSGALTRRQLDWAPTGPGLLTDLRERTTTLSELVAPVVRIAAVHGAMGRSPLRTSYDSVAPVRLSVAPCASATGAGLSGEQEKLAAGVPGLAACARRMDRDPACVLGYSCGYRTTRPNGCCAPRRGVAATSMMVRNRTPPARPTGGPPRLWVLLYGAVPRMYGVVIRIVPKGRGGRGDARSRARRAPAAGRRAAQP